MIKLREAGVDTPLLDANVLLGEVLDVDPARIPLAGERRLTVGQSRRFEAMVRRRATREPVAYIVGRKAFANGSIHTTSDVLVPRPDTEILVAATLAAARELRPRAVIDVGTGSGAVTVAESGIRSGAEVIAVGEAGYDAVLVGQSFVGAGDLAAAGRAVADLVAAGR